MVGLIDRFCWTEALLLIEMRGVGVEEQDDEPEGQKGGRIEQNELERTTSSAHTRT